MLVGLHYTIVAIPRQLRTLGLIEILLLVLEPLVPVKQINRNCLSVGHLSDHVLVLKVTAAFRLSYLADPNERFTRSLMVCF